MRKIICILCAIFLAGCASGAPKIFASLYLVHEPQPWQDEILKQHGSKWKGQNPYIEGQLGLEFDHKIELLFETGTSLFVGAPFNRSTPEELYWAKIKLGA